MPGHMNYITSGIICLASDLRENALWLQQKRQLAGDEVKNINGSDECASDLAFYPKVPSVSWYTTSRLIILGHGDVASTYIMGDGLQLDPKQLASAVAQWLGNSQIQRISLHMCFGGGNRGGAVDTDADSFTVHPSRSFAYKFASHCSLAQSVTARTERVNAMRRRSGETGNVEAVWREVGAPGAKRHKGAGDKVVFRPQGGTITTPVAPKIEWA